MKRIPNSEDQDFIKVEETIFAEDCKHKHHRDDYFYDEANQIYSDKDYDTVYDDQELHVSDYNHEKINEQDTLYLESVFAPRTWMWYSITTIYVKGISKVKLSQY